MLYKEVSEGASDPSDDQLVILSMMKSLLPWIRRNDGARVYFRFRRAIFIVRES